jgi:serine/threonine protein kinase, bacterial
MPLRIGETFAGYRILRLLGSGGMGEVYLVQHPRLPRHDALKVLRPEVFSDTSFRERFIREADLAAGLLHPHIVGIHDRGEHDGQLWIALDYIDGTDAAHLMQQRYPAGMPAELTIPIITAVASALDYAHKKGLLHRDVKPANIIVTDLDSDERRVYLADFGIARPLDDTNGLTTTNMTVGTVAYAAPEQLRVSRWMGDLTSTPWLPPPTTS